MNYRFFGANITPGCKSCHYGKRSSNKHQVLCIKKGVTSTNFSCKKYKYNPLRLIPQEQVDVGLFSQNRFNKEDFEL